MIEKVVSTSHTHTQSKSLNAYLWQSVVAVTHLHMLVAAVHYKVKSEVMAMAILVAIANIPVQTLVTLAIQ